MSNRKKEIREVFRQCVFSRDKFRCVMCGIAGTQDTLDAHHITDRKLMPNGGYVVSNGISLCADCHIKAEEFHISGGDHVDIGWAPVDLYKRINSSFQRAFIDSEKL